MQIRKVMTKATRHEMEARASDAKGHHLMTITVGIHLEEENVQNTLFHILSSWLSLS